jgi:hypothetical protein
VDAQAIVDAIATQRNISSTTNKEIWRAKVDRGGEWNKRCKTRRKRLQGQVQHQAKKINK